VKFWTLPNALTLFRIILIPFFILAFCLPFEDHRLVAAGIFLAAAITDWLDGFLARALNQSSPFGEFLDPVADKLIVVSSLVLLVSQNGGYILSLMALVIISREIAVSALREWMAELGKRSSVKVSWIGKLKTAAQMMALFVLIAQPAPNHLFRLIGMIGLGIAVVLTLWSMWLYLIAAWKSLE
jgi:CDP-diacylglycerol---glycerol-3-phosphate 3-phosphatidyltransferase